MLCPPASEPPAGDALSVFIAPLASARDALRELPQHIPAVAVEGDPADYAALVRVDQESGARLATEHLLGLGHATVWQVASPPDWLDARLWIAGWISALEAAGAEMTTPLTGDWSAASGYHAGRLLARIPSVGHMAKCFRNAQVVESCSPDRDAASL